MKKSIVLFAVACIVLAGCKKNDAPSSQTQPLPWVAINVTPLQAITVYNGKLVVGGYGGGGGNFNSGIAQLNDSVWSSLGSGIQGDGSIGALVTYNGKLIAAGNFTSIGGVKTNCIAQWDGTSWSALGNGFPPSAIEVLALMVYKGKLIATGAFDSVGGLKVNGIAQWDGTSWSAMGNGLGYLGSGNGLINYNGNIVVTGGFDSAGTMIAYGAAEWNGSSWDTVPLANSFFDEGQTAGGVVYNNNLVIRNYGYIGNIGEWNGQQWAVLSNSYSMPAPNPYCNSSTIVFNGNLMLADLGTVQEWNGSSWNIISNFTFNQNSLPKVYPFVTAFTIYNGNLVACGFFSPDNVAMYNGSVWIPL